MATTDGGAEKKVEETAEPDDGHHGAFGGPRRWPGTSTNKKTFKSTHTRDLQPQQQQLVVRPLLNAPTTSWLVELSERVSAACPAAVLPRPRTETGINKGADECARGRFLRTLRNVKLLSFLSQARAPGRSRDSCVPSTNREGKKARKKTHTALGQGKASGQARDRAQDTRADEILCCHTAGNDDDGDDDQVPWPEGRRAGCGAVRVSVLGRLVGRPTRRSLAWAGLAWLAG